MKNKRKCYVLKKSCSGKEPEFSVYYDEQDAYKAMIAGMEEEIAKHGNHVLSAENENSAEIYVEKDDLKIEWDIYISNIMGKFLSESMANELLRKIQGCRFKAKEDIYRWFRRESGCRLWNLVLGDDTEALDEDSDDFMNCSYGETESMNGYWDFTLFYIRKSDGTYYITEACWSY